MAKYKCIRKCLWKSRKWNEGDVVDLKEAPPSHFVPASIDEEITVFLNKPKDDPFKLRTEESINTFYEMAQRSNVDNMAGFASTLGANKSINNPKDFKVVGGRK